MMHRRHFGPLPDTLRYILQNITVTQVRAAIWREAV